MRALPCLLLAASALACGENTTPLPGNRDGGTLADGGALPEDAQAAVDGGGVPDAGLPPDSGPPDGGSLPLGPPITTPEGAWTWVDLPESRCDDGSPTGIGINRSGGSSNVTIFLNGGGACWDELTCFVLNTAVKGPFGAAEFTTLARSLDIGIFRRGDRENVFKDDTLVFVPYCTGDVHAGEKTVMYGARSYEHQGHANMRAFLARLAATFPDAPRVVLSGSSAGGFGAAFNYPSVRAYWPRAKMYLIDDSGPALVGSAVAGDLIDAWYASWGIGGILEDLCGPPCRRDLSLSFLALATIYPDDRLALLSSLQDNVIRGYFQISGAQFQTALTRLADEVIDPQPNFKYFFVPGQTHTMLGSPAQFNSGGKNLQVWLREQVTDDPAWASTRP